MDEHPPGPAPVARCSECNQHPTRPHLAECSIGAANAQHWTNVHVVEQAFKEALDERRADREFMARLRARIKTDGVLLEKLANP